MRGAGCRIRWNMALARELYDRGEKMEAIAQQVGTTASAIKGAADRWGWPPRTKPATDFSYRQPLVTKRCGCGARYRARLEDTTPHCESKAFRSLYEVAA
jgi:hypothetical protein